MGLGGLPETRDVSEEERKTGRSITATLLPVLSVLGKVEDFIGEDGEWVPKNSTQQLFREEYLPLKAEIDTFLKNVSENDPLKIQSIASYEIEEVNQFLRDHGFQIALRPLPPGPSNFGAASVMDVLVEWEKAGENDKLLAENNQFYEAVRTRRISLYKASGFKNPVVYLPTKNRDYTVAMHVPEKPLTDGFELLKLIRELSKSEKRREGFYSGVIFPKISLDQEVDIGWLENLDFVHSGEHSIIAQALQQTKFRMNEIGAHAESAAAVGVARVAFATEDHPVYYPIDRPFVCWIEKVGVINHGGMHNIPLFSGYIDYSDWRDPGSLSK